MRRLRPLRSFFLLSVLGACTATHSISLDAGEPRDAGAEPRDAGAEPRDASVAALDAGPRGSIGAPCAEPAECDVASMGGGYCQSEWPDGACIGGACELASPSACPGDSRCIPLGGSPTHGWCVDGCAVDGDCRDEYACRAYLRDGPTVCLPACRRAPDGSSPSCPSDRECNEGLGTCDRIFVPDTLGTVCASKSARCTGACLYASLDGFPGSYCSQRGCQHAGGDEACPDDGVCGSTDDGVGACLARCASDTDCRSDGYACRPARPGGPLACVPACTDDAQCDFIDGRCDRGGGRCVSGEL